MKVLNKKQTNLVKIFTVVACIIFLSVCCMSVIYRKYAPANPEGYHIWFRSLFGPTKHKDYPNELMKIDGITKISLELTEVDESISDIEEIWVNFTDLTKSDFKIIFCKDTNAMDEDGMLVIERDKFANSKSKGWFKVYTKAPSFNELGNTLEVILDGTFYLRELVILGEDDKVIKYKATDITILDKFDQEITYDLIKINNIDKDDKELLKLTAIKNLYGEEEKLFEYLETLG